MTTRELNRIRNAIKHQHQVSIKFGGNIIVIGTYKNMNTKIEYYCIQHDVYFSSIPDKILIDSRKGCIRCSGREIWTTESVIKRIQYLNRDQDGNNTLIIDEFDYKNTNQEIWLTCLIDGYRWKAQIQNLIHTETGCPECANTKITYDDLHRRNNEINTDEFGVLRIIIRCTREWYEQNYKGNTTKILVGCIEEDHPDWEVTIANLLNNETGCIKCAVENKKLTIDEFYSRIHPNFLNKNGNPLHKFNLRNFNGLNSFIWIFDPEHGWFEKKVSNYLKGYGHPNSPKTKSKGELAIQEFLFANQVNFIREYRIPELVRLRVDFFLAEQGIMIEFDGPQHLEFPNYYHETIEEFHKQQQNDRTKDQWCIDNGIRMIRITKIKDIPILLNFLINS